MRIHTRLFLQKFFTRTVLGAVAILAAACGDDGTGFRSEKEQTNSQPDTTEDRRERPLGFDLKNLQDVQDTTQNASSSPLPSDSADLDEPAPSPAALAPTSNPAESRADLEKPATPPQPPVASPIPANPTTPTPPVHPELPFLEIQFGQGTSQAAFISCATMHLTFFSNNSAKKRLEQKHFDLGCSHSDTQRSYPKTSVQLDKETECVELGMVVRTFRSLADLRKKGPYWERTLPASSVSSDIRFFALTRLNTGRKSTDKFEIGYEDRPGPYDSTDMDNNDLVLEITSTAGVHLRIPPFHANCVAEN